MARTRRIKSEDSAFYHVMSRITGKQRLLQDSKTKDAMLRILEKVAAFSGIDIGSFAILDNHFHLLIHIPTHLSTGTYPPNAVRAEASAEGIAERSECRDPEAVGTDPERSAAEILEAEVLRRIGILKGEKFRAAFANHLDFLRKQGLEEVALKEIARFRKRMGDLSQFVKTFKECFNVWYKAHHKYSGGLWEGRFKSTLVDKGRYLNICREYIELNPVRAGLVQKRIDYRWATIGAAKAGSDFAKKCRDFMIEYTGADHLTEEEYQKLGKRIAQISIGKFFGSREFVEGGVSKHFAALRGAFARIREVVGLAFSSHGHSEAA